MMNNTRMIDHYPRNITYECGKKAFEQMEKCICKVKVGNVQGTGFFCKIPFPTPQNLLRVFITTSHIIPINELYPKNSKIQIKIKEENDIKILDLDNRLKYANKEYDITIIEIKDKDNINNFLELDDNIMMGILNNNIRNEEYIDETIYLIHYPQGELSISFGVLEQIYEDNKYDFIHKCFTSPGSAGSPILNLKNKIIGLHQGSTMNKLNKFNIGLFLNYPIKEFIQINSH